ncbi:hypothetical protein AXF42_Ash003648 [Apostasia shenzhenica]|uniref:SLH domain-containing protein n=1 Tax=Apostasia shenzhenica TaxID=1088818 RepID=A0A2I0AHI2_9ASPA|nr:hypothetical protein AXF42_Ash003648 [Apostasia shenzhenica]
MGMALLMSPTSPGLLQLRSGRRCRESSSVFLRSRFRPYRCRILLVCSAVGHNSEETEGQSWSSKDAPSDSFAGWFGSDGEGGGSSSSKRGIGGMLGAGLAGFFFIGGALFATLSLSNRISSSSRIGVKQQMRPLTTEQEVLLSADDKNAEIVQNGDDISAISSEKETKLNEHNSDFVTGTSKESFPFENFDATEDEHHSSHPSAQIYNSTSDNVGSIDSFQKASSQEGLQADNNVDETLSLPASNSFSPELSANNAAALTPDASNFMEFPSTMFSGKPWSVESRFENVQPRNHVDLSSLEIVSTDSTIGEQDTSLEKVKSSASWDISNKWEDGFPSESLASIPVNPESSNNVESLFSTRSVVETVSYYDHDGVLLFSPEANTSAPVGYTTTNSVSSEIISGSDLGQNEAYLPPSHSTNSEELRKADESTSISYSDPVYSDFPGNEPYTGTYNLNREGFAFESILPEKSLPGIPAPSLVSAALQVSPGKIILPAVVDQVQSQALAALQVLKVIEPSVQPGDLCVRREYARWLVSASSALSRNPTSKVYPAMYVENVTELAFDDVTPEDPDFRSIQGEIFLGCSPVSRQDLICWKLALEKKQLPEVDKNDVYQVTGYIDIDKIDSAAWPALVADLSSGEHGITSLAFGYTRLFQPNKPVTEAQAAIALSTGEAAEIVGEELARIEAETLAETAVNAHTTLVAQVEKDLNASFEKELAKEREKIEAVEKLAEEARLELERIRAERVEENNALLRGRAAVESEMEVLARLRCQMEEQLKDLLSSKLEISFEQERINKLQKETESENQLVVQLQYELEVERKALSMARTWAEEEAKRARELAKALEEARERWEKHGIKVVVDGDLQEDASAGITWATVGQPTPVDEAISRGETLVEKLKSIAAELKLRSSSLIHSIIQKINALISSLKHMASESSNRAVELQNQISFKAGRSVESFKENSSLIGSNIGERARRVADDCRESVEKLTQNGDNDSWCEKRARELTRPTDFCPRVTRSRSSSLNINRANLPYLTGERDLINGGHREEPAGPAAVPQLRHVHHRHRLR